MQLRIVSILCCLCLFAPHLAGITIYFDHVKGFARGFVINMIYRQMQEAQDIIYTATRQSVHDTAETEADRYRDQNETTQENIERNENNQKQSQNPTVEQRAQHVQRKINSDPIIWGKTYQHTRNYEIEHNMLHDHNFEPHNNAINQMAYNRINTEMQARCLSNNSRYHRFATGWQWGGFLSSYIAVISAAFTSSPLFIPRVSRNISVGFTLSWEGYNWSITPRFT